MNIPSYRFCVAPMMDGTDRHCRYFHRLMTRHALLYSEMVTADALIHGDRDWLLAFSEQEHRVALQLGGSDPTKLCEAARIGAGYGYDEINLNVGCPSDRVQSGTFGACLMLRPDLVAECIAAMNEAVSIPVTVKCRIGVDEQDPHESLFSLVEKVSATGCKHFIVHARKAWLQGLSPKENRTIPPLDYSLVRQLKETFPALTIVLNGGLETLGQALQEMQGVDGVMLGRAPYARPWLLCDVDEQVFGENPNQIMREAVALQMDEYIQQRCTDNPRISPHAITRHMLGLFHGQPKARTWRQVLSRHGSQTPLSIIRQALAEMKSSMADDGRSQSSISAYVHA